MREMEKEEHNSNTQPDKIPSSLPSNKQEDQPHPPPHQPPSLIRDKPIVLGSTSGGGGGGDRLKRDEWSEGAVSSLLDAYESKWVLRNRAKLKGQDWEDVARHVSSRGNSTKSPKTQTQCKNKIESMKKRYRSESSATDPSSWPLFQRLDLLLRCRTATNHPPTSITTTTTTQHRPPVMLLDPQTAAPPIAPPPPSPPPPITTVGTRLDSHESNDVDRVAGKEEGDVGVKIFDNNGSDKISMGGVGSSGSTPVSDTIKEKMKMKKIKMENKKNNKKKRLRRGEDWEVADSIRWLAEVVMRSEQARIDAMKEVEKMRIEAEAKRGEMDLKRTEIIANTQLQIAKILANVGNKDNIDSSLRIGRS